jgi:hypothetical protein
MSQGAAAVRAEVLGQTITNESIQHGEAITP